MSGTIDPAIFQLFEGHPRELSLYEFVSEKLTTTFDDIRIKVAKTQVSFKTRAGFAFVSLPYRRQKGWPEHCIILSFGLSHELASPRIAVASNPAKNRWTHHFLLEDPAQLDDEVMGWLREAHDLSQTMRGRG